MLESNSFHDRFKRPEELSDAGLQPTTPGQLRHAASWDDALTPQATIGGQAPRQRTWGDVDAIPAQEHHESAEAVLPTEATDTGASIEQGNADEHHPVLNHEQAQRLIMGMGFTKKIATQALHIIRTRNDFSNIQMKPGVPHLEPLAPADQLAYKIVNREGMPEKVISLPNLAKVLDKLEGIVGVGSTTVEIAHRLTEPYRNQQDRQDEPSYEPQLQPAAIDEQTHEQARTWGNIDLTPVQEYLGAAVITDPVVPESPAERSGEDVDAFFVAMSEAAAVLLPSEAVSQTASTGDSSDGRDDQPLTQETVSVVEEATDATIAPREAIENAAIEQALVREHHPLLSHDQAQQLLMSMRLHPRTATLTIFLIRRAGDFSNVQMKRGVPDLKPLAPADQVSYNILNREGVVERVISLPNLAKVLDKLEGIEGFGKTSLEAARRLAEHFNTNDQTRSDLPRL